MAQYSVVLAPEMIGKPLELPAGCRVVERCEDPDLIEDEGGPALVVECDEDVDDETFSLLDVPGVVSAEPL